MIRPRARLLSHSSSFKRQCLPCRPRFVLWLPASHLILTITSVASWTSRYYRLLNFCVAFAKLRLPQRHLLSLGSTKLLEGHDRVALGDLPPWEADRETSDARRSAPRVRENLRRFCGNDNPQNRPKAKVESPSLRLAN